MSYRTRSARRVARNSKRNLFATIVICALIIYGTINFILPNLIGGIGFIKGFINPSEKAGTDVSENPSLAPPVLSIPYEATNTGKIDIKGFAAAHSTVKIYIDNELKSETETKTDGTFTAESVSLNYGKNDIYGKTLDENNQESLPSKTIKLFYDDEKPKLEVSEPQDGKNIQGERKIKVSGKTEDAEKVLVNGAQAILSSDGGFSLEISLSDGENNITVQDLDNASNSTEVTLKINFQS